MQAVEFFGPLELFLGLFFLVVVVSFFIVFFIMALNIAKIKKALGETNSSIKDIKELLKK